MRNSLRLVRQYASKAKVAPKAVFNDHAARQTARAPELSNLPAVASKLPKYISLRRTEPASAGHLIFRSPAPKGFLDPKHPFANSGNVKAYRNCPGVYSPLFTAKSIPYGLLAHAERDRLPPFPASKSVAEEYLLSESIADENTSPSFSNSLYRARQHRSGVIYASFLVIASKAAIHNHTFVRRVTTKRVKEALRLIVIRGAKVNEEGTGLIFVEEDVGEDKWLLKGWTYVMFPTIEAYRAPWPTLVTTLRQVLNDLNVKARKLADRWDKNTEKGPSNEPQRVAAPNRDQVLEDLHAEKETLPSDVPPRPRPAKASKVRAPVTIKQASTPSSHRTFSTTSGNPVNTPNTVPRRSSKQRASERHNTRGDIVLGTHYHLAHVTSRFFPSEGDESIHEDDFLPLQKRATFGSGILLDVDEEASVAEEGWSDEILPVELIPTDIEGWIILPREARDTSRSYSLDLQQDAWEDEDQHDDLHIDELLTSSNLPRFLQPHMPHHAGRGYESKLQHLSSSDPTHAELIQAKFNAAAEARRKERKKLRQRWNNVDLEWLNDLRQREIKRLERQHDVRIDEEKGGTLRAVSNKGDDEPWWAPREGSLGWVDPKDREENLAWERARRRDKAAQRTEDSTKNEKS